MGGIFMNFIHEFGKRDNKSQIDSLISYLETVSNKQVWNYYGMPVELACKIDNINENIKIYWSDQTEGFNDTLIIKSKEEFTNLFSPFQGKIKRSKNYQRVI